MRNTVMYQKTAGSLLLWVDPEKIDSLQLVFSVCLEYKPNMYTKFLNV